MNRDLDAIGVLKVLLVVAALAFVGYLAYDYSVKAPVQQEQREQLYESQDRN